MNTWTRLRRYLHRLAFHDPIECWCELTAAHAWPDGGR